MLNYDPRNWYWIVGGSTSQVYSSARLEYVSVTDATYVAWLAAGNLPTKIDADTDLQVALYQAEVLGVVITSTGTPAVNGTYPATKAVIQDLGGTTDYILLNGTFPEGASTMPWLDMAGAEHVFPSVAIFKEFATAMANFIAAMELFIDTGSGSPPSNAVTIA